MSIGQRLTVAISALTVMASASAGAWAADSIRPGYWESTNKVLSPIQETKTDRRCITPKDVAKFMSCHINHHYTCQCPEQSYSDGKIRFHGECLSNKGEKVRIAGEGDYTDTTLHMTAKGQFLLFGLPIEIEASTDAHRIGDDCPSPPPSAPAPPAANGKGSPGRP
jgi:hypothetical protein